MVPATLASDMFPLVGTLVYTISDPQAKGPPRDPTFLGRLVLIAYVSRQYNDKFESLHQPLSHQAEFQSVQKKMFMLVQYYNS